MFYLFLTASLVICLLVFLMFLILRKTVKKINTQTKLYFVDKSQEYDYLINEKVEKIKELDKELKEKEINEENKSKGVNNNNFEFDFNIIDLFNKTEYQDKNIFELNKKIDEKFNIDEDSLIKKFLSITDDDTEYMFCKNLKDKFTSDIIYSLKILTNEELDKKIKEMLTSDEYKLYKLYTDVNTDANIDGFIDYVNELIDLNNPKIIIYVGDKNKNYDNLSKNIKTVYSSDIYKGIKIKYHNKIYDYSLNERNV